MGASLMKPTSAPQSPPATYRVKSFGCQMNVYDGERMGELLAARGIQPAPEGEEADLVILNTCHIREKAAEKVYSDIGRLVKAGEEAGKKPLIAVAGCVAQAEGEEIMRARCGEYRGRPAGLSPPARNARQGGERRARDRHRHARHRQVRRASGASQARPFRLPHRAGRLRQVLHLLRGALYPRRGNLSTFQPSGRRSAQIGRSGREGDHAARPERQRLGGRGRQGPPCGAGRADPRACRDRWSGAHPLHHLASQRHGRRSHRRAWRGGQAHALSAPPRAGGERPGAEGDEPPAHRREIPEADRALPRRAARHRALGRFHRRFPGETEAEFAETLGIVDEVRYAACFSFKYSPRPGTPAATMEHQVAPR